MTLAPARPSPRGSVTLPAGHLPDTALVDLHCAKPEAYPVLLESVASAAQIGRHDLLLALPGESLTLEPSGLLRGPGATDPPARFLDALDAWLELEGLESDRAGSAAGLPFVDGWFLYLGYELAAQIEPSVQLRPGRWPTAIAWRMRGLVLRDRATQQAWVVAPSRIEAEGLLAGLRQDLAAPAVAAASLVGSLIEGALDEEPPGRFLDGVQAVLQAIARGDVYQANLSRGWRARLAAGQGSAELYRRLRLANPAPFAGSVQLPGFALLSSSPERLIELRDGCASTRPIAGTRPRGATQRLDTQLRDELRLDEKERAEHVMLVDLERNDLGRICAAGSVTVDELMTIESYSHVHHIVSNVRGRLRAGVTPGQAIAAVFPGGTITGCPKVRCMQLLAQLEDAPRDAYTGSIGFLDRRGSMDLNILIRTLTLAQGLIEFRTGAGIVADSRPEAELLETRAKALGLLRALGAVDA